MHKPKVKLIKYGEVQQLTFNPFENAVERALQQEFGEILVDGVMKASYSNNFSLLMDENFWKNILNESEMNIRKLISVSKGKNIENIVIQVCSALLEYHTSFTPNKFTEVFTKYFNQKRYWLKILEG